MDMEVSYNIKAGHRWWAIQPHTVATIKIRVVSGQWWAYVRRLYESGDFAGSAVLVYPAAVFYPIAMFFSKLIGSFECLLDCLLDNRVLRQLFSGGRTTNTAMGKFMLIGIL